MRGWARFSKAYFPMWAEDGSVFEEDELEGDFYDTRSEFGHGGFESNHEESDESTDDEVEREPTVEKRPPEEARTKLPPSNLHPFPTGGFTGVYPIHVNPYLTPNYVLPLTTPALTLAKKKALDLRRQIK
jgi:hypothetical protein